MDAHTPAVWNAAAQHKRGGAIDATFFELVVVAEHQRLAAFLGMRAKRLAYVRAERLIDFAKQ